VLTFNRENRKPAARFSRIAVAVAPLPPRNIRNTRFRGGRRSCFRSAMRSPCDPNCELKNARCQLGQKCHSDCYMDCCLLLEEASLEIVNFFRRTDSVFACSQGLRTPAICVHICAFLYTILYLLSTSQRERFRRGGSDCNLEKSIAASCRGLPALK